APALYITTGNVLVFGGSNALSVSDVDDQGASETVTLSVNAGTISLSTTNGLSFSQGDGTDDATMKFSGTLADINTALDNMTYSPDGSSTSDTLTITTNDNGHTGSGGPQQDTDTVAINIANSNLTGQLWYVTTGGTTIGNNVVGH